MIASIFILYLFPVGFMTLLGSHKGDLIADRLLVFRRPGQFPYHLCVISENPKP